MSLDSMKEIFEHMEQEGKPFWEIVLEADMDDRQVSRNQSMAKMLLTWQAMADAADNYTGRRRSVSGLVGGDGLKMRQYSIRGRAMSGGYVSEVIAEALSMAESNACMCRIVAAPTAGACGGLGNAADARDNGSAGLGVFQCDADDALLVIGDDLNALHIAFFQQKPSDPFDLRLGLQNTFFQTFCDLLSLRQDSDHQTSAHSRNDG